MVGASLRKVLGLITFAIGAVGVSAAIALVVMTTHLERDSRELADAVESVRLTEDATVQLLVHARASDPVVQRRVASDLRAALVAARAHVTSAGEERIHREAVRAVDAYLGGEAGDAAAFAALSRLVETNVTQARAARDRAARRNDRANLLGVSAVLLLSASSAWLVWWLRARVARPMSRVATALEQYGRGDPDTRAPLVGPREVRAIAARFNETADALQRHREAQVSCLGGIAHDLRNPAAAMRLTLDLLDGSAAPQGQLHVARLRRQLGRIERMAGDLLDVARVDAGKLTLDLHECDVREVIRDAVESGARRHRPVQIHLPSDPLVAWCDAGRIEQVVENLVGNAVKYSPADAEVEIDAWRAEETVVIAVRDRGAGLSEDQQRQLFAPFERVGERSTPGTGLGLYVSRGIVVAHGGRITVASAPGCGSTFRVEIPAA